MPEFPHDAAPAVKRQTERLHASLPEDIARAADLLRNGCTVAFPTETVYGLGANALDEQAVARIFAAKQRPAWDPLIVHIADMTQLSGVGTASDVARRLMAAFWPGPLTLLLPRAQAIPDAVTAGRNLVGVRMPAHPVALDLLRQAGVPVAAPSANTFSHTSPTTAQHVLDDLDGRIDAVLDGGATEVGVESTVAEVREQQVIVYRPGAIDLEMLDSIVGPGASRLFEPAPRVGVPASLPSPGVGLRHYAPHAQLLLIEEMENGSSAGCLLQAIKAQATTKKVGVMLPENWQAGAAHLAYKWGPWGASEMLAQRLFAGLRSLDEQGAQVIVCPLPYDRRGLGEALRDRLRKAARTS